jgi:hypothetical protein
VLTDSRLCGPGCLIHYFKRCIGKRIFPALADLFVESA